MALSLSARSARDKPCPLPVEEPRLSQRNEELSGEYSAVAGDESKPEGQREAAMCLSMAEKHLENEEHGEAEKVGREALEGFKAQKNLKGIADATRVVCEALCFNERRVEATEMAKAQLSEFEATGGWLTSPDKSGKAKMLLTIAEVNQDKFGSKNPENALMPATEALKLFKELGDKKMEASASLAMSFIHLMQSVKKDKVTELESATKYADEALALSREIKDKKLEGEALHTQAVISNLQQDSEQCIQLAQEALDVYKEIGLRKAEAFEKNCMAIWYLEDDKPQHALPAAQDALELYQEIGGGFGKEVWAMSTVVRAHLVKKEYSKAQKAAQKGAARFHDEGDIYSEAYAKCLLMMSQQPEHVSEALEPGLEALELFKSMKSETEALRRSCVAQVLAALSELNLRVNRVDEAITQAEEAFRIYRDLNDDEEQVATLFPYIDARMAKGDVDQALLDALDTQDQFEKKGAPREEANAWLAVSQCYSRKKDYGEALSAAKRADAIFQEQMDNRAAAHCQTVMYDIFASDEDYEKAQKAAERARRLWKSEGMKEAEANAFTVQVQMQIAATRKKGDKGGRSSAQMAKDWDKVLKASQDQLANAQKIDKEPGFAANGLRVLAETHINMGKYEECVNSANEAVSIYRENNDELGEAFALLLCAGGLLGMEEHSKSYDDATEALAIFKQYNETKGSSEAQAILAEVNKVLAARRAAEAALMVPAGGAAAAGVRGPNQPMMMMPQGGAMPAGAGGDGRDVAGALAGRSRTDMSAGITPEAVLKTISSLAQSIIGDDDPIDSDTPLMEAGLTSNTAVLLRDELGKDLPGISLPPTLIFDYPSVSAIADFIMEKANG